MFDLNPHTSSSLNALFSGGRNNTYRKVAHFHDKSINMSSFSPPEI